MAVDPKWLRGTLAHKEFPDGRLATVIPLTFGRARITLSQPGYLWYYSGAW